MEGSASQWHTQISYLGMTWKELQHLFLQRFETERTQLQCSSIYSTAARLALFTKWIPYTRVNTGEMKIRLIGPIGTV